MGRPIVVGAFRIVLSSSGCIRVVCMRPMRVAAADMRVPAERRVGMGVFAGVQCGREEAQEDRQQPQQGGGSRQALSRGRHRRGRVGRGARMPRS
jgi:hypothetical protein